MNKESLTTTIRDLAKKLFDVSVDPVISRPDEKFGDYSTNIALQLAKELKKSPRDIAEELAEALREKSELKDVSIDGPGFINVRLVDKEFIHVINSSPEKKLDGKEILVEFGDPNPFKAMHLGHLYTTVVGDAVARLLEHEGADVKRLSYHGDVGMHVAKAMWALMKCESGDVSEVLNSEAKIGEFYAKGATAYKEDPQAKIEIEDLNRQIYELRTSKNKDNLDNKLSEIYDAGFKQSFKGFDRVFDELDVKFKKRYLESECADIGLSYVKDNVGKVFEESDGAIIYRGEKVGLHTRVFINSLGIPTYDAKDLGLAELKNRDYPEAWESIMITSNEQTEYFKVMLAALKDIDSTLASKMRHMPHGFLSLTSGKMSSRKGIDGSHLASSLLKAVDEIVDKRFSDLEDSVRKMIYLSAIKYTFLRSRIGGDIVFDVDASVALEGNSGPYIQYAHARARSILSKSGKEDFSLDEVDLDEDERSLARKISEYKEVLDRATEELMPHHVCVYLYELAQCFNRFYEKSRVIGDDREGVRLSLVDAYADVLRNGLSLLGIEAPDRL